MRSIILKKTLQDPCWELTNTKQIAKSHRCQSSGDLWAEAECPMRRLLWEERHSFRQLVEQPLRAGSLVSPDHSAGPPPSHWKVTTKGRVSNWWDRGRENSVTASSTDINFRKGYQPKQDCRCSTRPSKLSCCACASSLWGLPLELTRVNCL